MKHIIVIKLMALSLICTGCVSAEKEKSVDLELIICPEERPEMCTMQYDPVCAELSDGSRKSYSTDCTACADKNVVGYKSGECK